MQHARVAIVTFRHTQSGRPAIVPFAVAGVCCVLEAAGAEFIDEISVGPDSDYTSVDPYKAELSADNSERL